MCLSLLLNIYFGFYGPRLCDHVNPRLRRHGRPRRILIDSTLLAFFFISITCLVSACTWRRDVPTFSEGAKQSTITLTSSRRRGRRTLMHAGQSMCSARTRWCRGRVDVVSMASVRIAGRLGRRRRFLQDGRGACREHQAGFSFALGEEVSPTHVATQ